MSRRRPLRLLVSVVPLRRSVAAAPRPVRAVLRRGLETALGIALSLVAGALPLSADDASPRAASPLPRQPQPLLQADRPVEPDPESASPQPASPPRVRATPTPLPLREDKDSLPVPRRPGLLQSPAGEEGEAVPTPGSGVRRSAQRSPFEGEVISVTLKSDPEYGVYLQQVQVVSLGRETFLVGVGVDTGFDDWTPGRRIWIALNDISQIIEFENLEALQKLLEPTPVNPDA